MSVTCSWKVNGRERQCIHFIWSSSVTLCTCLYICSSS
uniref:Uncharacterized protein n=1 Tax=Arundo donax TaxID=35708 RepID=A0A0A9PAH7_ARUDO